METSRKMQISKPWYGCNEAVPMEKPGVAGCLIYSPQLLIKVGSSIN